MERQVSYPVIVLTALLAVIAGAIGVALLVALFTFVARGSFV